ncbi:MAG: hypothetical protein K8R58_12005, partial [Bacteroidales bacterium]|nr:hypothetical protein [Bacteroidales bacterium]
DALRKKIIQELVINEKRNLVHKDILIKTKDEEEVVNELVKEGLLIKNYISGDLYYRLCHDRMITPLVNDLKQFNIAAEVFCEKEKVIAKAKEIRHKLLFASSFILVILLAFAIYFAIKANNESKKVSEQHILSISKTLKKSNPTLSYIIAKNWSKNNKHTDEFKNFINDFDSSNYSYLITKIPLSSDIVSVKISENKSDITLKEHYSTSVWNFKKGILKEQQKVDDGLILKKLQINNEDFYAVLTDDSLEIRDENGNAIKKFSERCDGRNLAISGDGKYILFDEFVYNFETKEFIGAIPKYKINSHDQMTATFLNDNKHLAVGYWSGYILIFNIEDIKNEEITLVAFYYPPGGSKNSVITSIVVDKNDKYLIAGNRQHTVEIWEMGKLNDSISIDTVLYYAGSKEPYKILKEHDGEINCLSISPCNNYVLSGSKDNLAILWDIESGKKISVLRGSGSSVSFVGFSESGKEMFTASDNDILCVWKRGNASKLCEQDLLARFCPFDYYTLGLHDMDAGQIYDTNGILNLSCSILHYSINIPNINQYPEDIDYLRNIRKSISEVQRMYQSLIRNPHYKDSISIEFKELLYKYQDILKLIKPVLLLETENETKENKYERIAHHHIESLEVLLLDTLCISYAISYANNLVDIAYYFADDTTKFNDVKIYQKYAQDVANAYSQKYPEDIELQDLWFDIISHYSDKKEYDKAYEISKKASEIYPHNYKFWFNLSYYALFVNEYKEAIQAADTTLKIKPEATSVKTNLALAYLLNNQWEKAKSVYLELKNEFDKEAVNEVYLKDIKELEEAGINPDAFEKFKKLLNN